MDSNNEIDRDDYRLRTGAELWKSFDEVDAMLANNNCDLKKAAVRSRANRRSVKALKRASAAGELKPEMVTLPSTSLVGPVNTNLGSRSERDIP